MTVAKASSLHRVLAATVRGSSLQTLLLKVLAISPVPIALFLLFAACEAALARSFGGPTLARYLFSPTVAALRFLRPVIWIWVIMVILFAATSAAMPHAQKSQESKSEK